MVKQGIVLCKNLVEPTDAIENLLMEPMHTIRYEDGVVALKNATKPFMALQVFQQELALLHKIYCKKPKASSSGGRA